MGTGAFLPVTEANWPSCPTWWSPTFHDLKLTHVHPAPHLGSIWDWHSWVTSGWGNWRITRGPVTPGRVKKPLKHCPVLLAGLSPVLCTSELALSHLPSVASEPSARALPLGQSPQGNLLIFGPTPKPSESLCAADAVMLSL